MKNEQNNQLKSSKIEMVEIKPNKSEIQEKIIALENVQVNNQNTFQFELQEECMSESGVKPQQSNVLVDDLKPKALMDNSSNELTPKAATSEEIMKTKPNKLNSEILSQSDIQSTQVIERPKVIETHSTPLLLKDEKAEAADYGFSLDSKKVDETIGIIDIENICKCLAYAILKHIDFSKGEVLIDDLVSEDEDIPQFSYDFDNNLRIDLEELQRKKEMEEWEAQVRNIENYQRVEFVMHNGQPVPYYYQDNNMFEDQEEMYLEASNGQKSQGSLLGDLPPLNTKGNSSSATKFTSHGTQYPYNNDLEVNEGPTPEGYSYSLVQMDDFLKDQGLFGKDSTTLVNSYYTNLSMMRHTKPFFFPPPDLGMVESLGSFENSSKFPNSVKTQKTENFEESKGSLANGTEKSKNTRNSKMSKEHPISELKSYESSNDSISGIKGGSERDIETPQSFASHSAKSSRIPKTEKHDKIQKTDKDKKTQKNNKEKKEDNNEEAKDEDKEENSFSQESYYILEDITKEGLQKFLREAMLVFNEKYSIEKKEIEADVEVMPPTYDLVFKYCKYVVIASKMEKEIPILALVYLERLLTRTGILMNNLNWRRLMLTTLCIASKIWDDDSLENEHFPKVMKDVTLKEINTFERILLDLIGYDLVIKGAEYAKYYFILRTIAKSNNISMPLQPLSVDKILKLQKTSNEAELAIRDFNKNVSSLKHSI